jgi:hypothetical protein
MLDDQRITIRELSGDLGHSVGSVECILTEDLGMRRISVKFVSKLLIVEFYLVQNLAKH